MSQPNVNIGLVSNLFVRQMCFDKTGDAEIPHTHTFDHLTLLAKGRLKVTIDGEETVFTAPQMIFIKADVLHSLKADSDQAIAYCIHALRDEEGDIISPDMVPKAEALTEVLNRLVKKE